VNVLIAALAAFDQLNEWFLAAPLVDHDGGDEDDRLVV